MATTSTNTYTFTRIEAVKLQFNHLLRYATEYDIEYINKLLVGLEKQYFKSFTFYATNKDDECVVELNVEVDWEKFNIAISTNSNIELNKRTTENGVSIIIKDWLIAYLSVVKENNLNLKWQTKYTDKVRLDENLLKQVRKEYNLIPSKGIKYVNSNPTIDESFVVVDIPEIGGIFKSFK